MFNPEQFLDMQVTESNDTKTIPVPVGEYTAVAEEVKCRQWQSKQDLSKSGLTLDITWSVDDAVVKELLGRDKVTVRQGIMLDITDSGGLDMGKGRNIGLGRLREATDLNVPGQPFAMAMLPGRLAKIKVTQRPGTEPDQVYNDVRGVTKAG